MARYSARAEGGCTAAGAELLRPAPPRARPRSCLPAGRRPGVLIRSKHGVVRIKPRAAVENLLFLATPTPKSSLCSSNSPFLLPFQATRAHQQLRQELRHRLHPLAQALIPHRPQPSRSPPTPAEAPPQALHRGQLFSELLNRRSRPCRSRGEPLMLMHPLVCVLSACSGRCRAVSLAVRHGRGQGE
jgi:hypothetical protein